MIADSDPGVPNWLDTCGHRTGFLTLRWTYSEPTSELPATTVTVMPQDQVAARLPDTTRRVTEAERRDQVRIRQEHVQRRYRQY